MIILGIDPGSVICGYGAIKTEGNTITLLEYGVIKAKKLSENFPDRLGIIHSQISKVIDRTSPDVCVFETMFHGKNVQSLIKLSHARSAAILSSVVHNIEVAEYSPNEVKRAVTGKGKAGKEQVQFMIQKLLAIKEAPEFYDATDALAVAVCHSLRQQNGMQNSKNKSSSKSWSDYIKKNPEKVRD